MRFASWGRTIFLNSLQVYCNCPVHNKYGYTLKILLSSSACFWSGDLRVTRCSPDRSSSERKLRNNIKQREHLLAWAQALFPEWLQPFAQALPLWGWAGVSCQATPLRHLEVRHPLYWLHNETISFNWTDSTKKTSICYMLESRMNQQTLQAGCAHQACGLLLLCTWCFDCNMPCWHDLFTEHLPPDEFVQGWQRTSCLRARWISANIQVLNRVAGNNSCFDLI